MTGRTCSRGSDPARVSPPSRSTPATAPPARASSDARTARSGRRRSCRWPRRATVKTLHATEVAELGYDMVLGNTFHLFIQPGHELIAELGGLHEFMGWDGRSSPTPAASRCSRWATARWPRRSSAARGERQVDGDLDRGGGRALPLLPRRRRALHGPRDLDGGAGRARLGHRARLRRVHALPRGSRLHGALDGAHPPLARPLRRLARASTPPTASCCTGSCRAACTRTCAPSRPPTWPAPAWTASRSAARSGQDEGADARGGGLVAARACPTSRRGTCSASATWTTSSHAVGAGIDIFDCATPTRLARHGTALVQDPERALAARPDQERARGRAASRSPRTAPARRAASTRAPTCTTSPGRTS